MRIVERESGKLSNFEVFAILKASNIKSVRPEDKEELKDLLEIQEQVLQYFKKTTSVPSMTPESVSSSLEALQKITGHIAGHTEFALSGCELFEIVNQAPRHQAFVHTLIESPEERFNGDNEALTNTLTAITDIVSNTLLKPNDASDLWKKYSNEYFESRHKAKPGRRSTDSGRKDDVSTNEVTTEDSKLGSEKDGENGKGDKTTQHRARKSGNRNVHENGRGSEKQKDKDENNRKSRSKGSSTTKKRSSSKKGKQEKGTG